MEPGERVNLIQSIYATFSGSDDPWNVIDMVLDEFGADRTLTATMARSAHYSAPAVCRMTS